MTDSTRRRTGRGGTDEQGPGVSELQGLLADERRRRVLSALVDSSTPVRVESVARTVAAEEVDAEPDTVPAERVERVQVALHHCHLPKLADADLVDYDSEEHVVEDAVDDVGGPGWSQ